MGGPTFSTNPANRPALPLVLATLVKLCSLQSSLTKLFSSPKDPGSSLSVESHEGISINRASRLGAITSKKKCHAPKSFVGVDSQLVSKFTPSKVKTRRSGNNR